MAYHSLNDTVDEVTNTKYPGIVDKKILRQSRIFRNQDAQFRSWIIFRMNTFWDKGMYNLPDGV